MFSVLDMLTEQSNGSGTEKARQLAQEVRQIADKYKMPFFFVTDGASSYDNNGCEAVRAARKNHEKWEVKNGVDPKHDWSKQ